MNILPKKNWHVRKKENIERVRRDEENARAEEEEIHRKIAIAESEARTDILRRNSRKRLCESESSADIVSTGKEHINFFKEEEQGNKKDGTNLEYEAEQKEEREKQEKNIGLLTYLGQSAVESQKEKPWYFAASTKRQRLETSVDIKGSVKTKEEFDSKSKKSQDPMNQMLKYVRMDQKYQDHNKEKCTSKTIEEETSSSSRIPITTSTSNNIKNRKDKKKSKKKKKTQKHKKEKKIRMKFDTTEHVPVVYKDNSKITSSGKSIAQLRAERMRREQSEKHKTESAVAKAHGHSSQDSSRPENLDERSRSYNSQYNPNFGKRNPHN